MSVQLAVATPSGGSDRFRQHDLEMAEYYSRNPPYDPAFGGLQGTEEESMVLRLREALAGRCALEIACGSGWATRLVAEVAASVVATDLSPVRLRLARRRLPVGLPVRFARADAYALEKVTGDFDAAYALAWFAHVPRERHAAFIGGLHRRVGKGGRIFLADECFNKGEDLPSPGEPDSYELRHLNGGQSYSIIDNKFDEGELRRIFSPGASNLRIRVGREYWWLDYVVA